MVCQETEAEPKPEAKPETYSDAEVIELCRSFKNGAKFQDLYSGGLGDSKTDSEADLAFLEMARFVTRDNRTQLDRLFRQSSRMRSKWNEKRGSSTYGGRAIDRALSYECEFYNPRTPQRHAGADFEIGGRYESKAMASPHFGF